MHKEMLSLREITAKDAMVAEDAQRDALVSFREITAESAKEAEDAQREFGGGIDIFMLTLATQGKAEAVPASS